MGAGPGDREPPSPYVVRFGPWARNLYLGLPAAFAFGVVGVVADMPVALFAGWMGVVALLLWICAFPREVRIYKGDRVVVVRRLLALLPVSRRTYRMDELKAIKQYRVSYTMSGESEADAHTVYLITRKGRLLPVQSYSSGADNKPPPDELGRALKALTGLDFAR
jgi:hypothetical protein